MSELRIGACLSLTGRYARFGVQAAQALHTWAALTPGVRIVVVDDASRPDRVAPSLLDLVSRSDLQLGPYSTQLMRAANRVLPDLGTMLWNHGGSGDDVEAARPGQVISVLTPTGRYAEPFVHLVAERDNESPLVLVAGRGSFGRQVIDGAELIAQDLGLRVERGHLEDAPAAGSWTMFCAATFEQDVETTRRALELPNPPTLIGSVAAGVHEFGQLVPTKDNMFGVAQWLPGLTGSALLGPSEAEFLAAHGSTPDYPAIQAVAAAVLATHCARVSGLGRDALWRTATELRTSTLFGGFEADPVNGRQLAHRTVLTRWGPDGLYPEPQTRG